MKWGWLTLGLGGGKSSQAGDSIVHLSAEDPQMEWIEARSNPDGGEPAIPTFRTLAYSGGEINVAQFGRAVVDLSGVRVPTQTLPILQHHDSSRIVGHSEAIKVAGSIQATGRLSGSGDAANEVQATAGRGFPWKTSIGGPVGRVERVEAGNSVKVNGRTFRGPINVIREMELAEISFVPIAGDRRTTAAIAAQHGVVSMGFEAWLSSAGFDLEKLSDEQRDSLKAMYDRHSGNGDKPEKPKQLAAARGSDDDADPLAEFRREQAQESRRVSAITRLCAQYGSPEVEIDGVTVDLAAHAIENAFSVEQAELHILRAKQTQLRASRPQLGAAPQRTDSANPDAGNAQVLECAMCYSAGISSGRVEKWFKPEVLEAANSSAMSGAGLHALFDSVLRAAGRTYSGSRRSNSYVAAVVDAQQHLKASGFTTLSVPGILSNVANKALIASYEATESAWPHFCATRSFSDFKVHTRYRLDSSGSFRIVPPDGQIKHAGLTEASYTNQLATYGAMLTLTRQDIINDDLGAFNERASILGRLAAIRIEEAVFVLLLSNPSSFFHANNANLITDVLTIDGLTAGAQNFLNHVSDGKPIMVSPKRLLVPTALDVTARELFNETRVDVSTTANSRRFAANPHVGMFEPKSSPYINNTAVKNQDGAAISGQSATQWYLFADPAVRAAMAVAFLNGRTAPTIESSETQFDTLGVQMRAYHDFGVGMEDPAAATKSTGAG